jgi:Na+/proline symporter
MIVAYSIINPALLSRLLPEGWASLRFSWRMEELAGTEYSGYEFFGALVLVWVLKGMLLNSGGPAQMYDFQRFLAARTPADASKTGAAWSLFLVVRWGMAMGIVLLALTGQSGIHDPEQVMPVVLKQFLPVGIRGVVIAGLLAAFMSTFSSTLNSGASYLVRDFWQPYLKKWIKLSPVGAGRVATLLIVAAGIGIGFQADSIAQIWNWMMMALGGGVVVPNVLRWYWWRLNGWGYAAGTFSGMLASMIALFLPELPMYAVFPPVVLISLIACITVSLMTAPVDRQLLKVFFQTVKPFGLWRPVREMTAGIEVKDRWGTEGFARAVVNTVLGMAAITGLYLAPMYLVGHWIIQTIIWSTVALAAIVLLYWTWYKPLKNEMV